MPGGFLAPADTVLTAMLQSSVSISLITMIKNFEEIGTARHTGFYRLYRDMRLRQYAVLHATARYAIYATKIREIFKRNDNTVYHFAAASLLR